MIEYIELLDPGQWRDTAFGITAAISLVALAVGGIKYAGRRRERRMLIAAVLERTGAVRSTPLAEGPATLAGVVRADPPAEPALAMRFVAGVMGFSRGLSPWSTVASLESHSATARPFDLVLHGSGDRVRVAPTDQAHLAALAVPAESGGSAGRSKRPFEAQLRDGERASVTGELFRVGESGEKAAYRGRSHEFELRGFEGGRLRVESESAARQIESTVSSLRFPRWLLLSSVILLCFSFAKIAYEQARSVTALAEVTQVHRAGPDSASIDVAILAADAGSPRVGQANGIPYKRGRYEGEFRVEAGNHVLVTFIPGSPERRAVGRRLSTGLLEVALGLLAMASAFGGLYALMTIDPNWKRVWFDAY